MTLAIRKLTHKPAEIFFQIRIAIAITILVSISSVIWVQTGMLLPVVGYSVTIAVPIGGAMNLGIILPPAHVVLRVRQAGQAGFATFEFGRAATDFGDDPLIVLVKRGKVAPDVGQDIFIGLMSRMGLDV